MKKFPVTRINLMHKTSSASWTGFPPGLSPPCFPLAAVSPSSPLRCGGEFLGCWSLGAVCFVLQRLSMALCLWAPVHTPVSPFAAEFSGSFVLCLAFNSYPVERRLWVEHRLTAVECWWFFLCLNNLMSLDCQIWATLPDKGRQNHFLGPAPAVHPQ